MSQEKLQSLLYSFIEWREKDDLDGIYESQMSADHDLQFAEFGYSLARHHEKGLHLPFAQCDNSFARHQGEGLGAIPYSPVQSLPFAPLTSAQTVGVNNAGSTLAQIVENWMATRDESNIKFKTHHLPVAPVKQNISVYIERSGNLNKVTKVRWKTFDKTALSGIHYLCSAGEIVFGEGEKEKSIEIEILNFEDEANDLRFTVELNDVNGIYNPKPLTIVLKRIDSPESDVINNLPSVHFSVADIKYAIDGCFSARTFHLALSHLCSTEESVQVQLALAFELSRLCYRQLKPQLLLHILTDFFRMDDLIDF